MKNKKNTVLKSVIAIIVIFLAAGALGYFVGSSSGKFESLDLSLIKDIAKNALIYVTPILFLLTVAFIAVFTLVTYLNSKKTFEKWDGEDEEVIEKAEKLIDASVSVLTIGMIVELTLYGAFTYAVNSLMSRELFIDLFPLIMGFQVLFVLDMIFTIFMQRACVELVKKINPEKKGEALAINFQKEWEGSMDEAQKLMTFEAGYKAYKFMNYAFIAAWVLCIMGSYFGLGLAPTAIVSVLWLLMTVSYLVSGYKIQYKNKKR
ncbi:MAG: DUF3169 family protein [Clostridia bacterium]|nr:DUF3169 family protein [Clostridia bacterium]